MALLSSDLMPQRLPVRVRLVPIGSTLIASAIGLLPVVATAPVLPPLGLMMALAWRLLRPEIWGPWIALPLGLADDLIGGAPLGTAATLWTIVFLGLDIADAQPMWRDYWLDWWFAAIAILFCGIGDWAITFFVAGAAPIWTALPTAMIAIILFPAVAWIAARLDRWRLRK
jgi:rod shape-determining protein MreD